MGLWDFLERCRTDWRLLAPILAADVVGMVFGWYYYWDVGQFRPGHAEFIDYWWWPLVADSPNAVLLFFVAILWAKLTGKRNRVLDAAAFILNIYVGLWTTFVFLTYPDVMATWEWGSTNNILFFAHLGMPLQALVLVPRMMEDRWRWLEIYGVFVAAVVYIFVDYWGPHIHPAPFLHHQADDSALHFGSPWLMFVAVMAWRAVVARAHAIRVSRSTPSPP